jgi:hypothetical protein
MDAMTYTDAPTLADQIQSARRRVGPSKHEPIVVAEFPIDDAIGESFTDDDKPFYAKCEIVALLGTNRATLPAGYRWNGADIPRFFWSIIGVAPTDRRAIIASGFHDLGCEDDDTPQVIADSNFVALLGPFRFVQVGNGGHDQPGVGRVRACLMYMAVRGYSIFWRSLVMRTIVLAVPVGLLLGWLINALS